MEWNFGADVVLTSIEKEYLELPAFYYLVKWKSFNTFVAIFLYSIVYLNSTTVFTSGEIV